MIQLCEFLSPKPEPLWKLIKQCGVDNVVAVLNGGEQEQRMFQSVGVDSFGKSSLSADMDPWSEAAIRRDVALFAENGLKVIGIEDTAPMDKVRLGLPGRDEQIENILTQIHAMGRLGIPLLCYNWMAISSWARTDIAVKARGGAHVTGFRLSETLLLPPLTQPGEFTAEQLWRALEYFLNAIIPVAEECGVQLGMHPDDPPLKEVRGIPRIMNSIEAYRRLLDLYPSTSNGITLCQGNFALMTTNLPEVIKEFGERKAIAFVHFRDVKGTAENFVETFHDEGQNDLPKCMRAYADIGFSGPMRPDHVPTMFGEANDRPAYGTLGRLFALGYIRGLEQSMYGRNF